MTKAFGGALSLALTLLILHLALPQVAELLVQIIVKILTLANGALDQANISSLKL